MPLGEISANQKPGQWSRPTVKSQGFSVNQDEVGGKKSAITAKSAAQDENFFPAIQLSALSQQVLQSSSTFRPPEEFKRTKIDLSPTDISPMVAVGASGGGALLDFEEYSLDILNHMKEKETKFLPKLNYMSKQPDFTFSIRSILVNWLVEVAEVYRLHNETIFLAVNYIDRFLSRRVVQRSKLQLVGTACMLIAAKYKEIHPPKVAEFCYVTADIYTKSQLQHMEQLVLEVLGFECSPPTSHFFVNHFAKLSGLPDHCEATSLAQYLAELTILDGQTFLRFKPSVIGAASVALARHTLGLAAWDTEMVDITEIRANDFEDCLIALRQSFSNSEIYPEQAVMEKYKSEKHFAVAKTRPTPIF